MKRFTPHIALVLIFTLTPAGAELTGNLLHLVATEHGAHAMDDEQHRPRDAEHGCSGSFHTCTCHRTPSVLVPEVPGPPAACTSPRAFPSQPPSGPAEGHLRSVFRPPRPA